VNNYVEVNIMEKKVNTFITEKRAHMPLSHLCYGALVMPDRKTTNKCRKNGWWNANKIINHTQFKSS
jgi:hypothetical protein